MMKKILLIAVVALFASSLAFGAESSSSKSSGSKSSGTKSSSAKSADTKSSSMAGKLGVGLVLGAPMGVSAKYYFSKAMALDAAAGWSLSEDVFRVHSDILFHNYKLLSKVFDGFPMALYYGAGAKFVFTDDFIIGVRIPVGVLHNFKKPSFDVFFEVVPVVLLTPDVDFDFDAALGARYYFGLK
jgi:hypothetical protein